MAPKLFTGSVLSAALALPIAAAAADYDLRDWCEVSMRVRQPHQSQKGKNQMFEIFEQIEAVVRQGGLCRSYAAAICAPNAQGGMPHDARQQLARRAVRHVNARCGWM
jgi:hypothetical protein